MGSLVFLLEAYFAWDWLAKLSSCSGSYWLELRSFPPQTVLKWWKAGSLEKVLIGPNPARLLASKTRFRSQKENMKGEDILCLYLVRSRSKSHFHRYLNRSSHTSYYSVTAFPERCGLSHTGPSAEICWCILFGRSWMKVAGAKCLISSCKTNSRKIS